MKRVVVGITGASGSVYGIRLLEILRRYADVELHLVLSRSGKRLAVAGDVRRAIYQAQAAALLALRDQGVVNDRVHQELQLDLDRANSDLRAG